MAIETTTIESVIRSSNIQSATILFDQNRVVVAINTNIQVGNDAMNKSNQFEILKEQCYIPITLNNIEYNNIFDAVLDFLGQAANGNLLPVVSEGQELNESLLQWSKTNAK